MSGIPNPSIVAALEEQIKKSLFDSYPKKVQHRLKALRNLQDEHDKAEAEFRKEVERLERQYHTRFAPLYEKRHEIVTGKHIPTDEECLPPGSDDEEIENDEDLEMADNNEVGITEFWLTAMQNHELLSLLIQENDIPILKHLIDVRMNYPVNEANGFNLEFEFSPNEYFEETILTKKYHVDENEEYDHLIGQKITWKEGKNPTVKVKKNGKERACESFFNFFSPPVIPDDDETVLDEKTEAQVEEDIGAGESFKEELIPRAILWYTGEAVDDEDYEGDEDDEDEDEDEDEDDDEEDDEDSDMDAEPANPDKKPETPAECKQQ